MRGEISQKVSVRVKTTWCGGEWSNANTRPRPSNQTPGSFGHVTRRPSRYPGNCHVMFGEEQRIQETIGWDGYHVILGPDHVTRSCGPIGYPGSVLVLSNRVWVFSGHCNATCWVTGRTLWPAVCDYISTFWYIL